jgi:hypothetical protein
MGLAMVLAVVGAPARRIEGNLIPRVCV